MRILIIEDEVNLAEVLAERFRADDYIVDTEYNGESGLFKAESGIYDAIILDIMLPKMNGFEVLRNLRREQIVTPVLMLTAKSELDDKVNGLDMGADDYLTKPFEMKELLARVRAMCRRRGDIDISVMEYGDISMQINKPEIVCRTTGDNIKLGNKEYLLMEYFIRNS